MNTQTSPPPVLRPFASCHDHPMRRTCMLMVTHGCNLNCTYCYEKFKNGAKTMSVDLAKEIIRKEINIVKNDDRFEELEVDFMGGEPLLRFDLIKEIIEWMEQICDIPFLGFASTNGTLLTDEMKTWFRKHCNAVYLGASYDGIGGDAQSVNRGDAATHVDLTFFREVWPKQGFKMTHSKNSLRYLYESMLDAAQKGYPIDASLAQGENWDIEDALTFQKQLRKLSKFYLENPQYPPAEMLTRDLTGVGQISENQVKFCGTGTYMATYDVDGTLYGCHMFTPIVLGKNALPHSQISDWTNEQELTDSTCKGCCLMNWCPTCFGFNLKDRGDVRFRDHRWCVMNAVHAMSACEFQIEYFHRLTQKHELMELEARILQSAIEASSHLSRIDITKPFPQ